ncbi:MAG: hypothetical protein CL940_08375 [Deltaproteobacteria bacterium]|nr:hypothetical protein [Deltaproteobacteria bacterium]
MNNRPLILALLVPILVAFSGVAMAAGATELYDEPEFGTSLVLGSLFCDTNGDGKRQDGELGLGGVDVRADTGDFSRTDRDGRFHLRRLTAGQRLIKIDATTVAGAKIPAGGLTRHLRTTPGMIFRVDFGVSCSIERVTPDVIDAPTQGVDTPAIASTQALASTVLLAGQTTPAQVTVDSHSLPVNIAGLEVDFPGRTKVKGGHNLSWHPGPLKKPIVFKPEIISTGGEPAKGATWRIDIAHVGERIERTVRSFFGSGEPPDSLSWDGTDPSQVFSVLDQGQMYRAILTITDGHGAVSRARPITFGVDYGQGGGVVERLVIRGILFDEEMNPTRLLGQSLGELKTLVEENPESRLLIEVHTDDSMEPDMALSRSRRGAFLTAEALVTQLQIERERIDTLGYGGVRPLLPNISERNRTFNRRLEITLLTPTERAPDVTLSTPIEPAGIWLQGNKIKVHSEGHFLGTTPRPGSGIVSLRMVNASGVSWERAVDLKELTGTTTLPAEDPLRAFGGDALRRALGDPMIPGGEENKRDTAGQIELLLPPSSEPLQSPWLYLSGTSHPRNTVTANGVPVVLDSAGRFAQRIPMPVGESALEIVSTDALGFVARVTRSYTVTEESFFLMALVDGAGQLLGGHLLDDAKANTSWKVGDSMTVGGRAAVTFKGRIRGTKLAEELFVLAHLDTGKNPEFQPFHAQLVDPSRDYAVFADEAQDDHIQSRGPLYVLVRADRSKLTVGNVRPDLKGLGLVRYNRALYGALLELDHAFAPGYDTQLKGFVSEDTSRLKRGHDELRATGGSLYYLSRQDVLQGSERVQIVRRERDSRLELERRALKRDEDYRIDYRSGRITLSAPLSSTVLSSDNLVMLQPLSTVGAQVHGGHEVWIVVDYESTELDKDRALAGAVEVRQKITDRVTVTGGFVTETHAGDGAYQLYGGGIEAKVVDGTMIRAEVAGSSGYDGTSYRSNDGGLRYEKLAHEPLDPNGITPRRPEGMAFNVELVSDIGKSAGRDDLDLKLRSWWQVRQPEFNALGQIQDQGTEKAGGLLRWNPTKKDAIALRFDYQTALTPDDPNDFEDGLRQHTRSLTTGTYARSMGRFDLQTQVAIGQHRDSADGKTIDTQGLGLGGTWRLRDDLKATLGQQLILGGDDVIWGEGAMPRLTTRVGVAYQASKDVGVGLTEAVRWDGDNATMFSVRTKLDEESDLYVGQQLGSGSGAMGTSTVLGAETRQANGARSYSEYRLDDGVNGRTNRAVLGLSKKVHVADGVALAGSYERSQTFGGLQGDGSRDVIAGGLEILPISWLKFGSRYELRLDQEPIETDEDMATTVQAVALNGLTFNLSRDTNIMLMANFDLTQNLATRDVLREGLELTLAGIHRPRLADWLTITGRLSRYQRRYAFADGVERLEGTATHDQKESVDLLGVGAIIELPRGLELTEHAVYRYRKWLSPVGESSDSETLTSRAQDLLSIHRLGYRMLHYLDLSLEYRLLAMLSGDDAMHHGYLAEIAYAPGRHLASKSPYLRHMRVALGYDFSAIPRTLEPTLDDVSDGGVYLRITGAY